ncbi:MAG TPA: hypothetical protein VD927_06050 [Chryseosolibacter sp.]|nr:hypothetical protein [Chryseosolibacter sp.]
MKIRFIQAACFLMVALFAFACGEKKSTTAHEHENESEEWKEMDDYHMVMAETFHPYKDSADLAPVKAKANDLVASAEKWLNAPLPKKVDNDQMKSKIERLKNESVALRDKVQAGNDQEIGDNLTKLHDTFHEIQETWYGGGKEHGHDHEH